VILQPTVFGRRLSETAESLLSKFDSGWFGAGVSMVLPQMGYGGKYSLKTLRES
jgi:hypothetical protein